MKLEIFDSFSKNTLSTLMKTLPVGAELFLAD